MTKKTHIKHVATPTEASKKIADLAAEGKIIMPKGAELNFSDKSWEELDFSHVDITAVGFHEDEIGIDGNGNEHKFPGGMWICVNWAMPGFGFGEINIKKQTDGVIEINAENLPREFVMKALVKMVEGAKLHELDWSKAKRKVQ